MGRKRSLDFSHWTGIVGIVFLILGFIAYGVGIYLSMEGTGATSRGEHAAAADWNIAAMYTFMGASIGMVVALILLVMNWKVAKGRRGRDHDDYRERPPACRRCGELLRSYEMESGICDPCYDRDRRERDRYDRRPPEHEGRYDDRRDYDRRY